MKILEDRIRELDNWVEHQHADETGAYRALPARIHPIGSAQPALEDFVSYLPEAKYIDKRTGTIWDTTGINRAFPPIPSGRHFTNQSDSIDAERPIHGLTWLPGEERIIENTAIIEGGRITLPGHHVFNQYRPPHALPGNAAQAGPWIDLLEKVYSDDAEHIACWFAHRVQRPHEKLNHAIVLGGHPGIGKDSLIQGVIPAVGAWNVEDVSPANLTGRFNGFLRSVILRVSELRDTGDADRYGFYEHTKTIIAAPPDTLLVDEKHIRAYRIPNLTGVVFTTNHRTDGLYLPEDDRRHYVAWSEAQAEHFSRDYWPSFYSWLDGGGFGHVAAYLRDFDIDAFNPKAPPPKTQAFWDIVAASRAPEDAPMADALEKLGNPSAVTLADVISAAASDVNFQSWLQDRRNARKIPHRFEDAGYVAVRNSNRKDGYWVVDRKRQPMYAQKSMSIRDRLIAAQERSERFRTWST